MSTRHPACMAEHQKPPLGDCYCDELWAAFNDGVNTAAGRVEEYAFTRLAEIAGPQGGVLPVIPSPNEDIVAALRVAARRARGIPGLSGEIVDRPKIVVLCGSTRFYDAFQLANYELTMAGKIVLSVGFYPHADTGHGEGVGHNSPEKVKLDELHKRKIDLADEVFVLNVGGYIGNSTRSEIEYAQRLFKPITYLEDSGNMTFACGLCGTSSTWGIEPVPLGEVGQVGNSTKFVPLCYPETNNCKERWDKGERP